MMYPEAFLHPEVKLLDEGSWFTITHSHLVYFIPTLSASTKLSEALLLDVVNSLTLRVKSILSICASLNLIGSAFTWRSRLTDAWGNNYSIALRQSKSNRKRFHLGK